MAFVQISLDNPNAFHERSKNELSIQHVRPVVGTFKSLVCLDPWKDAKHGIWVGLYCKECRIYGRELSGLYGPWIVYWFYGEWKTQTEAFKAVKWC